MKLTNAKEEFELRVNEIRVSQMEFVLYNSLWMSWRKTC